MFRPGMDDLKTYLNGLGATHVLTYSDLLDKNTKGKIREWTGGKVGT